MTRPRSPIRLRRRKKTRNHSLSVGLHNDLLPQSKCPRWPSLTQSKVIGLGCSSPDNHQLTGFVLHGSSLVFGRVRRLELSLLCWNADGLNLMCSRCYQYMVRLDAWRVSGGNHIRSVHRMESVTVKYYRISFQLHPKERSFHLYPPENRLTLH